MLSAQQTPSKTSSLNAESICAVVVAYFPDPEFHTRLHVLLPQIGKLVIVDNTPEERRTLRLKEFYGNDARVFVLENNRNLGIAAALNQGLGVALEQKCEWLLTLDQDTNCNPDMMKILIGVSEACGEVQGVIGGNYFDFRKKQLRVQVEGDAEYKEQKTVITAGSLINARLAQSIGGFREDYFIDQVDHEFCLRVRAHGYRVFISGRPVMEHSIGGAERPHRPLLGLAPPDHPPLRKYYIARNSLVTVMDYWKTEPMWCLNRLVGLLLEIFSIILLQKNPIQKLRAFLAGITDGLCRRMGAGRMQIPAQ